MKELVQTNKLKKSAEIKKYLISESKKQNSSVFDVPNLKHLHFNISLIYHYH